MDNIIIIDEISKCIYVSQYVSITTFFFMLEGSSGPWKSTGSIQYDTSIEQHFHGLDRVFLYCWKLLNVVSE